MEINGIPIEQIEKVELKYLRKSFTSTISDVNLQKDDEVLTEKIETIISEIAKDTLVFNIQIPNISTAVLPPINLFGNSNPAKLLTVLNFTYTLIVIKNAKKPKKTPVHIN